MLLALTILLPASPARADAVSEWFETLQSLTAGIPPASDPVAEQAAPLLAIAMHDAVAALEGADKPFLDPVSAPPGASVQAAAHSAAHAILVELFPDERERLDGQVDAALFRLPEGQDRSRGVAFGQGVARQLLAKRGLQYIAATTAYRPPAEPGVFVPPQLPAREWLGRFQPFILDDLSRFTLDGPPALDSDEYARDLAEVRELGSLRSAARSREQSEAAQFWHSTDIGQLLPIVFAAPGRSLADNARLFAAWSTAMFDAGILLSREKYRRNFWRPVTAIRNADIDGNPATLRDETWEPLLATPAHPDCPCGHCLVGAMVAVLLQAGAGHPPPEGLVIVRGSGRGASESVPARRFTSWAQMAEEIALSRIWGGVHFRRGAIDGAELGRRIAMRALQEFGLAAARDLDRVSDARGAAQRAP